MTNQYPRIEDTLLNRVLAAGLRLGARMASIVELRRESRRLASLVDEQVTSTRLDGIVLDRAERQINRLTAAYLPALSIIRLLVQAHGVVLEGETNSTPLPGFLFDMNAFFQTLVSGFLQDNLSICASNSTSHLRLKRYQFVRVGPGGAAWYCLT